jgi:membrane-bound lytic murein transglycosylase D
MCRSSWLSPLWPRTRRKYGLDDLVLEKPVPYDTLKIDYPVDLRLVAECVGVSANDLQDLNPSLLRWTTPENGTFELRLPEGTKDQYKTAIAAIPEDMRVWWRYHNVVPGDTLSSIARSYRTTPAAIAEANHVEQDGELQANAHLVIPIAPGKHAASEDGQTFARRITRYKVRRGDTVQRVAENFNVPPAMLRRWNHLRGDSLRGRRVLYLHLPVSPASPSVWTAHTAKSRSKKTLHASNSVTVVRHTVKPGETLVSIASSHKTSVEALPRDNGKLSILRPGMVLLIRPGK